MTVVRSSIRRRPAYLAGKSGSIFRHCSVGQIQVACHWSPFSTRVSVPDYRTVFGFCMHAAAHVRVARRSLRLKDPIPRPAPRLYPISAKFNSSS